MIVRKYLEERGVAFETRDHAPTYTASRLAHTLKVPGDNVAKTVLLKVDRDFALAVIPATHQVNLRMARDAIGAGRVAIAHESELGRIFDDCEFGVIPPFGSHYGLLTIVEDALTSDDFIVFEGNRHDEAIAMTYEDYERIEEPERAPISRHE